VLECLESYHVKVVLGRCSFQNGWILESAGPKSRHLYEDNDLVFCNEMSKRIDAGNMLYRYFWPLIKKAGLPRIRFHDRRHSTATLHMSKRIHPKIFGDIIGHSQISITLVFDCSSRCHNSCCRVPYMNVLSGSLKGVILE